MTKAHPQRNSLSGGALSALACIALAIGCGSSDEPDNGASGDRSTGEAGPGASGGSTTAGSGNSGSGSDSGDSTDPPPELPSDCTEGPLPTSRPNCEPELPETTGSYHQDCVNVINAFRAQCQCLGPLERWTDGEACADEQAEYDYGVQDAHEGWLLPDACDGGRSQNECPGWGELESITGIPETEWGGSCLAFMWHEVDDPGGIQGHYESMSSTSHTMVACGYYTSSDGETWAVQNFK